MHAKTTKNSKKMVEMLLDIYAKKTNLPVGYFDFDQKHFIWSTAGSYSPVCTFLNDKFAGGNGSCQDCDNDHIARCEKPDGTEQLCHAGLWNIALPIEIDGKVVGALITGQRRLDGAEQELISRQKFSEFLRVKFPNKPIKPLNKLYEDTPVINIADFDRNLLESLKEIQEYFYRRFFEHEKDRKNLQVRVQSLAHEFLLPIQSIIADAENIYTEVPDGQIKAIALNILQEMQKLAIIAENMRSSLVGAKSEPYEFSSYSTIKLLKEAIDLYKREARKKGVDIHDPLIADNKAFPNIYMSYPHMKIAINNIIHNAVKYSYSSVSGSLYIDVQCKSEKNYFVISIANLGIGILPDEISDGKIFEAGYRGRLSADRHRTGSGLGLSEVKKIIEAHRGRIEVQSIKRKNDAYKTIVSIYLPYRHTEA